LDERRYAHEQVMRIVRLFPAPAGVFTAWVSIVQGGDMQTLPPQPIEVLPPLASQWRIGQPLVSQAGLPRLRNELSPAQGELNWTTQLWTPEARPFVLRVLLHRLDNPEGVGDALLYVSIYQGQQVMESLEGGLTPLQGAVPLADLPPGPYLLEVLALGEERVLAVQRVKLRILWDDEAQLLSKPDSALRLLTPLVGRQTVERLQDAEDQRRFWQQFWARRSTSSPFATQGMEEWHLALKAALKRYATDKEGYPDDRAGTYARLGPPDRVSNTSKGEKWTYDVLQLEFSFPR
jgi:GWxTD domain-containing protein